MCILWDHQVQHVPKSNLADKNFLKVTTIEPRAWCHMSDKRDFSENTNLCDHTDKPTCHVGNTWFTNPCKIIDGPMRKSLCIAKRLRPNETCNSWELGRVWEKRELQWWWQQLVGELCEGFSQSWRDATPSACNPYREAGVSSPKLF